MEINRTTAVMTSFALVTVPAHADSNGDHNAVSEVLTNFKK